jgi:hypothetical protein
MGRPTHAAEHANRATAALVARKLAALGGMTGAALAAKFEEVLGFPSRTRNKPYLRKRLAWAIQAQIEGGLSERALQRIDELAAHIPERWKRALDPRPSESSRLARSRPAHSIPRDPRLPSPETVITRSYQGTEHRVTVLIDGFEYQGKRYRSLSAIAREITGVAWNGFTFFFGRADGTRKPE